MSVKIIDKFRYKTFYYSYYGNSTGYYIVPDGRRNEQSLGEFMDEIGLEGWDIYQRIDENLISTTLYAKRKI